MGKKAVSDFGTLSPQIPIVSVSFLSSVFSLVFGFYSC